MFGICGNGLDTMWQPLYPKLMALRILFIAVTLLICVHLVGCAGKSSTPRDRSAATAQEIVDSATDTLRGYLEGSKKEILNKLLAQAKGAMIIPGMGNVSFFFSIGGGNGVMMARTDNGWSGPAFLSKGTGGIGIQAGVTKVSGIILYMNEEDVRYVLETGAVLQGQAAITFLDADFEGNRTPEFYETGDVVFVGDTSGLFAGIGVSGGGMSNRDALNAAYHGVKDGNPENVLFKVVEVPAGARHLRDLLVMAGAEGKKSGDKPVGRTK